MANGVVARIGAPRLSHFEWIDEIHASADGAVLSCSDNVVRRWNVDGSLDWQVRTPLEAAFCAVSDDGSTVAYGQGLTSTQLVVRRGQSETKKNIQGARRLVLSSDGTRLLVLGAKLELWDTVAASRTAATATVAIAAGFQPDGNIVFIARDEVLRWSGVEHESPVVIAKLPSRAVAAAFDGRSTTAAWAASDKAGLVDLTTGDVSVFSGAPTGIGAVALTDDGKHVVLGAKAAITSWHVHANAPAWSVANPTKNPPVVRVAPGGKYVLFARGTQIARIDLHTGTETPAHKASSFKGFASTSTAVISIDGSLRRLDLATMHVADGATRPRQEPPEKLPEWADDFAIDGGGVAIGWQSTELSECKPLRIWTPKGDWRLRPPGPCDKDHPLGPWFTGPGIVGFVTPSKVLVFDAAKRAVTYEIDRQNRQLWAVEGAPTRDSIAVVFRSTYESTTGAPGWNVEIWTPQGQSPRNVWTRAPERLGVGAVSYARDGRSIVVGWRDGAVDQFGFVEGERTVATHDAPIEAIQRSADGTFVASTDRDDVTLIWRSGASAGR